MNPILQRLRRHGDMSVIFRKSAPGMASSAHGQAFSAQDNAVKATLVPPGSILPVGFVANTMGAAPAAARTAPLAAAAPVTMPAIPKTAIQRQAKSDPGHKDDEWSRLESIMHLHNERDKSEAVETTQDVLQPQIQRAATISDGPDRSDAVTAKTEAQPEAGTLDIARANRDIQRSDDAAQADESTFADTVVNLVPAEANPMDSSPQKVEHQPAVESAPEAGLALSGPQPAIQRQAEREEDVGGNEPAVLPDTVLTPLQRATEKVLPASTPLAPVVDEPSAGEQLSDSRPAVLGENRAKDDSSSVAATAAAQSAEASDAITVESSPPSVGDSSSPVISSTPSNIAGPVQREVQAQQRPLEASWPVQKAASSEAVSATQARVVPETVLRQPDAGDESVRQRLEDVPTGEPSASPVPVMMPRRPRPVAAEAKIAANSQPASVQTKLAQNDTALAQDSLLGQGQPEKPEPASTVPTEIGELPQDLWQLIGKDPPPAPVKTETTIAPEQHSAVPEQAANETTTIQRQPENMAEVETADPPAPEENLDDEVEGEGVDVDELARRVYSDLKRRLSVEWERTRGR